MSSYRTGPVPSSGMPDGIPYIIVNDVAERFSFFGVRAILVIFMTQYLMTSDGVLATYSEQDATSYFHLFTASAYFLPLIGAIVSDAFLGKYRTIIFLSLVYCAGHLSLALDDTRIGLFMGLTLIAFGSGGTSVDTTGKVVYKNPRVSEAYEASGSLYNRTYQKSFTTVDADNKIEVVTGASYSDIKITSTLAYAEPSGQELFDTSTDNEGDYVFDELGLFTNASSIDDAIMLTHVIFHPVQKSQNRIIEIVYTVRIQLS